MGAMCIDFKTGTNRGCQVLAHLHECNQGLAKGCPSSLAASPCLAAFLMQSQEDLLWMILFLHVSGVFGPGRYKDRNLTQRSKICIKISYLFSFNSLDKT